MKSTKFRGWKIVLVNSYYNLYLPEDVETYTTKQLVEYATPEFEDIDTIENAKEIIRDYNN